MRSLSIFALIALLGMLVACGEDDGGTGSSEGALELVEDLAGETIDCTGWPNGFYSIQLLWLGGAEYQVHVYDGSEDEEAFATIEVTAAGEVLHEARYDSSIGTFTAPGSRDDLITIDAERFEVTLTAQEHSGSCVIFGEDVVSHWWEFGSSDDPEGEPGERDFTLTRNREYTTDDGEDDKVTICHIPPGNPDNAHTIHVGASAVRAHTRNHGDTVGPCGAECQIANLDAYGEPSDELDISQIGGAAIRVKTEADDVVMELSFQDVLIDAAVAEPIEPDVFALRWERFCRPDEGGEKLECGEGEPVVVVPGDVLVLSVADNDGCGEVPVTVVRRDEERVGTPTSR